MNPMFFICVGELLGTIHRASTEERELGMHYKRNSMAQAFEEHKAVAFPKMDPKICDRILEIEEKVNQLPQEIGQYGLCHGDFHLNNFFVEANNIWLFDFDGCAYADYMYDGKFLFRAVSCLDICPERQTSGDRRRHSSLFQNRL